MRRILVIIALFQLCLSTAQKNDKNQIDSIFIQTKKIEIYAYYDQNKWDKNEKNTYLESKNIIEIPKKHIRNKVTLTSYKDIKKLKKSIVKSSNKIEERANCYDPRHTIVFYNENNDIIGFVEICFSCMNSRTSDNFTVLKDKILYQEKLFQEFGITYFEDTKEENEAYWKKIEEKDLELQLKFNKKNE